jgi:hypothetical protein
METCCRFRSICSEKAAISFQLMCESIDSHSSGPEGHVDFASNSGTAEAVPFQNYGPIGVFRGH